MYTLILLLLFIWTPSSISTPHADKLSTKLRYSCVRAEVGSTVTLPCHHEGGRTHAGWFRMADLEMVSYSDDPDTTESPADATQSCSLIIKNVEGNDAGFYKFVSWSTEAGNMNQHQRNMVQLIVGDSPAVDMESVWDAAELVPAVADVGGTAVLPCSIKNEQRVWIRLKDSRLFSLELPGSNGRITSIENGMQIVDVKPEDAGVYRCERVTDPTRVSYAELKIKHHKESTETIPSVIVGIGETATLPCNLQVPPRYRTSWLSQKSMLILTIDSYIIIDDERFSVDLDEQDTAPSLILRNVRFSDAGIYVCNTNNVPPEHASVQLRIKGSEAIPPSPTAPIITLAPITVIVGETAKLPCGLEKNDSFAISWIRERDSSVLTINDMTYVSDVRVRPVTDRQMYYLSIRYVELEDSGVYKCSLLSSPKQESQVELVVKEYKPEIKMEVEVVKRVKVEDTVVISCDITGTHDLINLVLWYKDGHLISANEDMKLKLNPSSSTLTIPKSRANHSGAYTCEVKHPTGDHNSTINLQVTN